MAITSLDGLIAAPKQQINYVKSAARSSIAGAPFSIFDLAGSPSGTLAMANTANGIVPTDAINGYPPINTFAGGATGYLSAVQFGCSVAARMSIADCLFSAGVYAFNANTTLTAQPSYASRIPNADYKGTEIWVEAVTAFTGIPSFTVTYTNQDGTAGRTITAAAPAALLFGRMFQLPLQPSDTGVQSIQSIVATVATAGTFNLHVMRRLWQGRVRINNDGDTHDFTKTGMPVVFDNSALRVIVYADSTSTGLPELQIEIANG